MRLPREFYARPALEVAPELLGKRLVLEEGSPSRAGRIVEVEAYIGEHDLAAHSSKGRTPRTDVMFGPPGHAYVYFIYGMHWCFNVVTEREGVAAAVLVRALEPISGFEPGARTDGPARLCAALGITGQYNRADLVRGPLGIEDAPALSPRAIARGPRIGVDYAGAWAKKPYRFWVKDNRFVSRPR